MDRDQGQPGPIDGDDAVGNDGVGADGHGEAGARESDAGTPGRGMPDAGTTDAGTTDAGTPGRGMTDASAPGEAMHRDQAEHPGNAGPTGQPTPNEHVSGFAAPGGFDGPPALPYQTGEIPPAPQFNPYAQVPGAPAAAHGGNPGYPGQPGPYASHGAPSGYPGSSHPGSSHPGSSYPGYQGQEGQQGYQSQPGSQGQQSYPGYPGQQGYAGYPGQPGQSGHPGPGYPSYSPPPSTPGKGLAIAALVLAILALLICWIPVVNFLSFPFALVALGLGIPALVKGLKARNAAKTLSIVALSLAGVSIITAIIINTILVDSLRDAGVWDADTEVGTEIGGESFEDFGEFSEELSEAELEDYSYEYSEEFIAEIVAAPANSAGEEAAVGDYTVTLTELDRDASAEVLERAPSAGDPDHNYVIARFDAVYNGEGEGRPWLDLAPELVGSDNRIYTVLGCTVELSMRGADQDLLSKGDSVTHEVCFDVPDSALGEDSRLGLRMILAEENAEDVYWRLP